MNLPLLATLSFNLLLAVAMLVRETSLRRSLQRLLRRLLSFGRNPMKRLIGKVLVAILIIVVTGCISSDVQSPTAVVPGLGRTRHRRR